MQLNCLTGRQHRLVTTTPIPHEGAWTSPARRDRSHPAVLSHPMARPAQAANPPPIGKPARDGTGSCSDSQRFTDLRWFEELPRGGHFAALEQPKSLVEQVRRFFRLFR